jgi:threonine aldolase
MDWIDLRSDTVTKPTPEMREAMARAEVGDDVYGEDPTVNRLEARAAELLGKQAGLYVPSGTMGNLAAVLTHCGRGSEIILGEKAHTFLYEVGGISALGGIHPHTIPNQPDGTLKLDDIRGAVRGEDIHDPPTRLILLENTHNRCGGVVLSPAYTRKVAALAAELGLKVHLDGARIFNAAAALDVDPVELTDPVDSVMFCLSKGLSAPVGSVLCGSREFIDRARKTRKMLGGGMRQAGVIAAAGLYALEHVRSRLTEDHRRAQALAAGLKEVPGLVLDPPQPATNMVYCNLAPEVDLSAEEVARQMRQRGMLIGVTGERRHRLVTHLWIDDAQVNAVVAAFEEVLAG